MQSEYEKSSEFIIKKEHIVYTTTLNLMYAKAVQEEHLRRAQNQPNFSQIQARGPLQGQFADTLADLLINSGRSLKQRTQAA